MSYKRYVPLRKHAGKVGQWRRKVDYETHEVTREFVEMEPRMVNIDGTFYFDAGNGLRKISVMSTAHQTLKELVNADRRTDR